MSDSTFGKRLASARKKTGLSQEALAREINVAAMTISRYERDAMGVDDDVLERLAKRLGVTPAMLRYGNASLPNQPLDTSTSQLEPDPILEQVIAEEECTPEEAAALRSANWKLVAGANYSADFIRRVLLARRRPAPAVQTELPANVARLAPKKTKR